MVPMEHALMGPAVTLNVGAGRCTPSTRALAEITKQAWFALINRKIRMAPRRSRGRTKPPFARECRALDPGATHEIALVAGTTQQ